MLWRMTRVHPRAEFPDRQDAPDMGLTCNDGESGLPSATVVHLQ